MCVVMCSKRSTGREQKSVCRPWAKGTRAVSNDSTKAESKGGQAERFNSQQAVREKGKAESFKEQLGREVKCPNGTRPWAKQGSKCREPKAD
jgi:hypothetical protein